MNFLLKFINYWINTYDFQEREKYINKYPHFIANIRGKEHNNWKIAKNNLMVVYIMYFFI